MTEEFSRSLFDLALADVTEQIWKGRAAAPIESLAESIVSIKRKNLKPEK